MERIVGALLALLPPGSRYLAPAIRSDLERRRYPGRVDATAEVLGVLGLVGSEWLAVGWDTMRGARRSTTVRLDRVGSAIARRPSRLIGVAVLLGAAGGAFATVTAWARATPRWLADATDRDRLVWVMGAGLDASGQWTGLSTPEIEELVGLESVGAAIGIRRTTVSLAGGSRAEAVSAAAIVGSLAEVLGTEPELGRWPDGTEAVVSDAFARLRLGGPKRALERSLWMDEAPVPVVGVLGEHERLPWAGEIGPERFDVVIPAERGARSQHQFFTLVRLAADARPMELKRDLPLLSAEQRAAHPRSYGAAWHLEPVDPAAPDRAWSIALDRSRGIGALLLPLTLVVLALTTRLRWSLGSRSRDVIGRAGASPGALAADRCVLDLLRGGAGLLVGVAIGWVAGGPGRGFADRLLPGVADLEPDDGAFGVALLASVSLGVVVLTCADLIELRLDRSDAEAGRPPAWLAALGAAITIAIMASSALALRSWHEIARGDRGADVAFAHVRVPDRLDGVERARLADSLIGIARRSGIAGAVGAADYAPLTGPLHWSLVTVASPRGQRRPGVVPAGRIAVTAGYLRATGGAMLAGRFLEATDADPGGDVVVVDSVFAAAAWGDARAAVGAKIALDREGERPVWHRVVGVARAGPVHGEAPARGVVVVPMAAVTGSGHLALFAAATAPGAEEALAKALARLGSSVRASTVTRTRAGRAVGANVAAYVGGVLAPIALLLGTVVAGSFARLESARRRSRLAVEMALGRSPASARAACALRALVPTGAGAAMAVAVVLASAGQGTARTQAVILATGLQLTLSAAAIHLAVRRAVRSDLARDVMG